MKFLGLVLGELRPKFLVLDGERPHPVHHLGEFLALVLLPGLRAVQRGEFRPALLRLQEHVHHLDPGILVVDGPAEVEDRVPPVIGLAFLHLVDGAPGRRDQALARASEQRVEDIMDEVVELREGEVALCLVGDVIVVLGVDLRDPGAGDAEGAGDLIEPVPLVDHLHDPAVAVSEFDVLPSRHTLLRHARKVNGRNYCIAGYHMHYTFNNSYS